LADGDVGGLWPLAGDEGAARHQDRNKVVELVRKNASFAVTGIWQATMTACSTCRHQAGYGYHHHEGSLA
jgi:hypothetical protein